MMPLRDKKVGFKCGWIRNADAEARLRLAVRLRYQQLTSHLRQRAHLVKGTLPGDSGLDALPTRTADDKTAGVLGLSSNILLQTWQSLAACLFVPAYLPRYLM